MKNNNKFKSYSFWMSVCAAVVLVINNLAKAFGFSFQSDVFTATVDSICGVLVVLGVLTMSKKEKDENNNKNATTNEDEKINSKTKATKNINNKSDNKKTE